MTHYRFLLPFMFLGVVVWGQNHFEVNASSKKYNVIINVENCDTDQCKGKATIDVLDKNNKKIQSLTSEDLVFRINENQKPVSGTNIRLDADQSPLVFGDFNFDGTEDVAVRNGNMGNYGSASHDVYVFNSTKKQFVLSKELTELATVNMDMFETDAKRKRLIAYGKSGCCRIFTTEYTVIPNKGLDKVFEKIEDTSEEETVQVTTKEKVNNKWVTKTKKYTVKEYYKGK
ncbi:hypothetical protein N6B72_14440 [Chryseobacterium soli]|uniref:FG-GAP repeat protein n=1 Tax=Chryseobacterium soli TaxID=445961 RepID=UPI0029558525|nr:hypothetical protein [Chryseobacterium soli]MDV7698123.1 hypothetical protein [Chryseobacterium soli]